MGGGSKTQTVGYKYYLGMHMIAVHGPVDHLTKIKVDDKVAWEGVKTSGRINISKESLFGGESREGGISGALDFESGISTQGQNDYLVSQLGSVIPSFRGVAGFVLRKMYLGINPYLKPWSFVMQRIHKKSSGATQWYDAKSSIPVLSSASTTSGVLYHYTTSGSTTGWSADPVPMMYGTVRDLAVAAVKSRNDAYLREYSPGAQQVYMTDYGYDAATEHIWVAGYAYTDGDPNRNSHYGLGPIGIAGLDHVRMECEDGRVASWDGDSVACNIQIPINDMNPAHIIRECLTDTLWGMGYQESDIDDASFTTAADTLYAENMGISLVWDRQSRLEDFIQEIIKHIYAVLYVDRVSGKFVLKLIRNDYSLGMIPQLDETNVIKIDNYSRPSFGDLVNSVSIIYQDSDTNRQASVSAQDTAMVQLQGSVISTTIQYPGFSNFVIAARVAQRDLIALSTPLLTCNLTADRTAATLNVGDVFRLYWPDFSDEVIPMRITSMSYGDGKSNRVKITAMQDIFTTPSVLQVQKQDNLWSDSSQPPDPVTNFLLMEVPYAELVQRLGQVDTDSMLSANPDAGYFMTAVGRPANGVNCIVLKNESDVYEQIYVSDYAPSGSLSVAISKTDTTIVLTDYDDLEQIKLGQAAQLGTEIVKVTAMSGATLTIERGIFDTVPASHAIGTKFLCWDEVGATDGVEYVYSENIDIKFKPVSGGGDVDIEFVDPVLLTLNRRAIRPYPPGQFKVAGSYFPASVIYVPISISWVHRHRTQQTGSDYISFLDAGIGPESGTTYSVRLYNDTTSVLLHSANGLTGTAYASFPQLTGSYTLRVELWSVRSGYDSFQKHTHVFSYINITRLTDESLNRIVTEDGLNNITTE